MTTPQLSIDNLADNNMRPGNETQTSNSSSMAILALHYNVHSPVQHDVVSVAAKIHKDIKLAGLYNKLEFFK